MKKQKNNRDKWLHLRLSMDEYERLNKSFASTTERKLSAYSRNILLGTPMIKGYRNLSSDALIAQFTVLIKTLNGIANNFNQAVHKLHTLREIPEITAWYITYEMEKRRLINAVEQMRDFMNKHAAEWLQS